MLLDFWGKKSIVSKTKTMYYNLESRKPMRSSRKWSLKTKIYKLRTGNLVKNTLTFWALSKWNSKVLLSWGQSKRSSIKRSPWLACSSSSRPILAAKSLKTLTSNCLYLPRSMIWSVNFLPWKSPMENTAPKGGTQLWLSTIISRTCSQRPRKRPLQWKRRWASKLKLSMSSMRQNTSDMQVIQNYI